MHNFDIEKYINGEMKGDELEAFDRQLKLDPDLKAEVHQTRELIKDLRQLGLSEKIHQAQKDNRRLKWFKWMLLVGLISLGIFLFYTVSVSPDSAQIPAEAILPEKANKSNLTKDSLENNSKEPLSDSLPKEQEVLQKDPIIFAWQDPRSAREMADHYFSTPEDFSYLRGSSTESPLDSAKMEFNAEAYANALQCLQKLTTGSFEKYYFQALCFFRLGKYAEAGDLFKLSLSKSTNNEKRMEIEWYSFLNALACGKPCYKEFTSLAQSIQRDSKHPYFKQVKLIFNKKRASE